MSGRFREDHQEFLVGEIALACGGAWDEPDGHLDVVVPRRDRAACRASANSETVLARPGRSRTRQTRRSPSATASSRRWMYPRPPVGITAI